MPTYKKIYTDITVERVNQNWPKLEKLCRDQDNKNFHAGKNLTLKEHRHLYFKLLVLESNFEIFVRKKSKLDTDFGFLVNCSDGIFGDTREKQPNSAIPEKLIQQLNLSLVEEEKDTASIFPNPSSGIGRSKLAKSMLQSSKNRDRSKDPDESLNLNKRERSKNRSEDFRDSTDNLTINFGADDNKTEIGGLGGNGANYGNSHTAGGAGAGLGNGLGQEEMKIKNKKEFDLEYFLVKFKDLTQSFKKLPKDKKKELVDKFKCYGYIESSIHLARCHFYNNNVKKCFDLLSDILVDKYDSKLAKINQLNLNLGKEGLKGVDLKIGMEGVSRTSNNLSVRNWLGFCDFLT